MDKVSKVIFNKGISLSNTIFLFSLLIVSILTIVIASQLFFYSEKIAISKINSKLEGISIDLKNNIEQKDITYSSTVKVLSFIEEDLNVIEIYTKLLETNSSLYAIYTFSKQNDFIQVIDLNIDKELGNFYNAKENERWLLLKSINHNVNNIEYTFYDKDLKISSQRIKKNNYDAKQRPWFKSAVISDNVTKTFPYHFINAQALGITYSKKSYNNEFIISLDLLIHNYLDSLKKHIEVESMDLFLFDPEKNILSYLSEDVNIFKNILNNNFDKEYYKKARIIEENDKKYILKVIDLETYNNGYLAVLADYELLTKPYKNEVIWLLSIFVVLNILTIPFILYLSRIITKPIYSLVEQSNRIKSKDFNIIQIDTNINEIALLSDSFTSMSKSIFEHQTYLEEKISQRTEELRIKNAELKELSITDKLTSLYNRTKLDDALKQEFERAKRYESSFSLIILDIDFFKLVNDNFGHKIGDDVLKETASILKSSIRESDILGRWGGEEFLIICPNSSSEDAILLAEKLNQAIKNHIFSTYPKQLTISLGISSFNKNIKSPDELLNYADIALYKAKENGRDKAVIFDNLY
ncbi:GGDEF domain-containing protein [Aliarcobacter thereius]|uniref:GGDEF domain-containing protein n=1 Tax=Aliarcobacter thereius TaxID=544718 RepID=UPI00082466E2|nr:GGDEF domain-containing protein [Aliarcobacter thereius]OCL91835.1 Response regulator PleD [Aliarcobacter thereius]